MSSLSNTLTQVIDELATYPYLPTIQDKKESIDLMLSLLLEIPRKQRTREIYKSIDLLQKGETLGASQLLESILTTAIK